MSLYRSLRFVGRGFTLCDDTKIFFGLVRANFDELCNSVALCNMSLGSSLQIFANTLIIAMYTVAQKLEHHFRTA